MFKRPGEESDNESDEGTQSYELLGNQEVDDVIERPTLLPVAEQAKITIHEDD